MLYLWSEGGTQLREVLLTDSSYPQYPGGTLKTPDLVSTLTLAVYWLPIGWGASTQENSDCYHVQWEETHNHISLNITTDSTNFNGMHITLLNCRLRFSGSGLGPKFCVSNQLQRNTQALSLKMIFWATRTETTPYTTSYTDISRLKILDKPSKWNLLCIKYTLQL